MCGLPALIAGAAGGNPVGATVGSLFGIPGAVLGGMMGGKKKPAATGTSGVGSGMGSTNTDGASPVKAY